MTLSSSIGPFDITQHPSKKTNPYCARFRQVAALQKRANQLTAEAAKPMLLDGRFKAIKQTVHLPPVLPGEEFEPNQEP